MLTQYIEKQTKILELLKPKLAHSKPNLLTFFSFHTFSALLGDVLVGATEKKYGNATSNERFEFNEITVKTRNNGC